MTDGMTMVRGAGLVSLAGLALTLSPSASAVASAELYTTQSYRYGRFEARVQFPAGDGVVGSFFLWKPGSEMSGAYWNELDFEKIRADCALQLNSLYGQPVAGHETFDAGLTEPCTGYHTYAYEWTPESITWTIDGQEVRRDTGADAQTYVDNAAQGMQLHFNVWVGTPAFGGTFSAGSLPLQQYISWVRYSAYTPGTGDGGSDFSLAWHESFDNGIPSNWALGSWASPLAQSTHSPANVKAVAGVAVLSLTADAATGFTGVPPLDDQDAMPAAGGSGGTRAGGTSTTGAGGSGTPAAGSAGTQAPGGADESGCSLALGGPDPGRSGLLALGLLALGGARRRLTPRGRSSVRS